MRWSQGAVFVIIRLGPRRTHAWTCSGRVDGEAGSRQPGMRINAHVTEKKRIAVPKLLEIIQSHYNIVGSTHLVVLTTYSSSLGSKCEIFADRTFPHECYRCL